MQCDFEYAGNASPYEVLGVGTEMDYQEASLPVSLRFLCKYDPILPISKFAYSQWEERSWKWCITTVPATPQPDCWNLESTTSIYPPITGDESGTRLRPRRRPDGCKYIHSLLYPLLIPSTKQECHQTNYPATASQSANRL